MLGLIGMYKFALLGVCGFELISSRNGVRTKRRKMRKDRQDPDERALLIIMYPTTHHNTTYRHKAEVAERRKPKAVKAPRVL